MVTVMPTDARSSIQRRSFDLRTLIANRKSEYSDQLVSALVQFDLHNPQPSIFRRRDRKAWTVRRNQCTQQVHSKCYDEAMAATLTELSNLQAQCPHEFSPFGATQMGPELIEAFQSRTCAVCGKTQVVMDTYGGCGIG